MDSPFPAHFTPVLPLKPGESQSLKHIAPLPPSPLLSQSQQRRPRQRGKSTETAALGVCRQKTIRLLVLLFTGWDLKRNLTSELRKLPGRVSAPSYSSSAFQALAQPERWQLFQHRYFPGLGEPSEFRGTASPPCKRREACKHTSQTRHRTKSHAPPGSVAEATTNSTIPPEKSFLKPTNYPQSLHGSRNGCQLPFSEARVCQA